jgi:hypothetical protein
MQINNKVALDAAIMGLEKRRLLQEEFLVAQFKATRESLSPMNLIKDGFRDLSHIADGQGGILKTAAGIGVGMLSKKLFLGSSPSIIKKLLGAVFEVAIAKSTISNADKIKAYGISVYHNLFKKKSNNGEPHKHTVAGENGSSHRFKENL